MPDIVLKELKEEITQLRKDLAEREAECLKLRKALENSGRLYCTMIGNDLMSNPSMFERSNVCTYVRGWFRKAKPKEVEQALSTPQSSSYLERWAVNNFKFVQICELYTEHNGKMLYARKD